MKFGPENPRSCANPGNGPRIVSIRYMDNDKNLNVEGDFLERRAKVHLVTIEFAEVVHSGNRSYSIENAQK
jgi:hypothetical protein